jgi:hypothetical protein
LITIYLNKHKYAAATSDQYQQHCLTEKMLSTLNNVEKLTKLLKKQTTKKKKKINKIKKQQQSNKKPTNIS